MEEVETITAIKQSHFSHLFPKVTHTMGEHSGKSEMQYVIMFVLHCYKGKTKQNKKLRLYSTTKY